MASLTVCSVYPLRVMMTSLAAGGVGVAMTVLVVEVTTGMLVVVVIIMTAVDEGRTAVVDTGRGIAMHRPC